MALLLLPSEAQAAAHDLLHDLGRAAVEPLHPGVSPEPGDLVLVDVAVAAVQLQAAVHDFPLQFGGPPLGPGRLFRGVAWRSRGFGRLSSSGRSGGASPRGCPADGAGPGPRRRVGTPDGRRGAGPG